MRFVNVVLLPTLLFVGCGGSSSVAGPSSTPTNATKTPGPTGAIGGAVTINGEVRPMVWVQALHAPDGYLQAFGTNLPGGSWDWDRMPVGDYVLVITTPPGLTCDATRKSVTVARDQRAVVNFACVGDLKGSIVGVTSAEFGAVASAQVNLTGPVNRATTSNQDGFFAFQDLPPGEYSVQWCKSNPVTASVGDGAVAFAPVNCS
jgi:hypothetical protein